MIKSERKLNKTTDQTLKTRADKKKVQACWKKKPTKEGKKRGP
jgi:hypothetical protein